MQPPTYDDIRQQVARRYSRLGWFIFHLIMAITSIIVIWSIDPTPQDGTPVLAGLWAGVLIFHAVKIYLDGLRDQAVERTWAKYQGSFDEKPKRTLLLHDDTELEVVDEEARQGRLMQK